MSLAALWLAAAVAAAPVDPQPAVPTIPPATIDDTLEIVGDDVDAQLLATRMAVEVKVNGQGPFRFVVDSGADRSVIGAALARRLALPEDAPVTLRGMAGTRRVPTVLIEKLTIGSSDIAGIVAPALPERHLGAQGLLGIDALAEQRLMMDFDRKTITIQDSRVPLAARSDEIVVTARRRRGQLILTQVKVGEKPIYAVIDTGAQITVGNMALYRRIMRGRRPPAQQPTTLISVTGQTIVANLTVLPLLRIGGLTLQGVPVAFVDAPPFSLFGLADDPALLLGADVLEVFRRVSLDFRHRKVRFALR